MKGVPLLLSFLFFWGIVAAYGKDLEGAWLIKGLEWKPLEGDTELRVQVADAAILYFSHGGDFIIVYCILLRRPKEFFTISRGDGETVYKGDWTHRGEAVLVNYRLVERAVPLTGVKLPGPMQNGTIKMSRGRTLIFEGKQFLRAAVLDYHFK